MGRRSDAKARILAAAQELIEQRGYSQIGVAEICQSAGVPKGSFYYFFDSKDALALAVIEMQWEAQHATWSQVLSGEEPPLERLRRVCEVTAGGLHAAQQSCGSIAGCMFGNLALELRNQQTEAIRDRLREIFEIQTGLVAQVLAEATERGDIRAGDVRDAARSVVAQLEGQIMFAKLYNDIRRLDLLWPSILALLGGASLAGAAH
jgi:TetR/AcrR family transcriptional repressor of nem operon